MLPFLSLVFVIGLVDFTVGHSVAWSRGMYCFNGTNDARPEDTNKAVRPFIGLPKSEWWMHHDTRCDEYPPAHGDFLELPAGGSFTVEIAQNRAFTTFSYGGKRTTEWPDGQQHPSQGFSATNNGGASVIDGCIASPNFHTKDEQDAHGTSFAISYQSDIRKVTAENLVVFTVAKHTPWKRLATYDVPAGLPECPSGGCHCVWSWLPNGCGPSNTYLHPFKCRVTGAILERSLSKAQAPRWCEDDPSKCVKGAKQMIYWNQADGNNVFVEGNQKDGLPKHPSFNMKMGFLDGAQNDIFESGGSDKGNAIFIPQKRYERPYV